VETGKREEEFSCPLCCNFLFQAGSGGRHSVPPRPSCCVPACLRPEHRHLLLCHLLATDWSSEQRHPASLPLPLAIWSCGKPRLLHASSLPWPHPCLHPCLNTEEAPELVAEESPGLRCLGNGDGSCCFIPGAALVLLCLQACKWPPLPQGRKL
jgi:hypothetical protein